MAEQDKSAKKNKKITKRIRIFNLLKPVEEPKGAWDKVYDWIVDKARIIIFIVELLIIVAFVAKFVVDNQAKNKEEQIEAYRTQEIFYQQEREPLYRDLQFKARDYERIWDESSNHSVILNEVYSLIPANIEEIEVTINAGQLTIRGYDELRSLELLESAIKGSSTFTSARVDDLSLQNEDIINDQGRYVLIATISEEVLTRSNIDPNNPEVMMQNPSTNTISN